MSKATTLLAALALSLSSLLFAALLLQPPALAQGNAPQDTHIVSYCSQANFDAALAAASNGDTIWVRCSAFGSPVIIDVTGTKIIDKSLTIIGDLPSGGYSTLDGGGAVRIFTVNAGHTLTLTNIYLQGGHGSNAGGCIRSFGSLNLYTTTIRFCDTLGGGGAIYANGSNVYLQNVTLFSNDSSGPGGGLYATMGTVTISGSRVDDNTSDQTGGGIYLTGTVPYIANTRLLSNHAVGGGGGIESVNSPLVLASSTISGNTAGGGAGLENYGSAAVQLTGNLFQGNQAAGCGGGVHNQGKMELDGNRFILNSGVPCAGGVLNNFDGNMTIRNTLFHGNSSTHQGGAVANLGSIRGSDHVTFTANSASFGGALFAGMVLRSSTAMTDVVMSGNTAANAGGAIYAESQAAITLTRASIISNTYTHNGGGLYAWNGSVSISDATFEDNRSDLTDDFASGGGLYLTGTATLRADGLQLLGNGMGWMGSGGGVFMHGGSATLTDLTANRNYGRNAAEGGALYLEDTTAVITGLTAMANYGAHGGGGIALDGASLKLADAYISANTAAAHGGGISAFQSGITLTSVTIQDNDGGSDGGGVYCYSCLGTWRGITVSHNIAPARMGGGLHVYLSKLLISDATIAGNSSTKGGGINNERTTLGLDRVTINGNTATSGGGIYNGATTLVMTNTTVSGNTAAAAGGGLYNYAAGSDTSVITMTNVTLKDNAAVDGGGIYNLNATNTRVYLKNTVLADSLAGGNCKGKAMHVAKYSLSTDPTCNLMAFATSGNLDSTPAMLNTLAAVGGPTRVHLPRQGSILLDMILGSDAPNVDQRGYPRPAPGIPGNAYDVGAVERQATDPDLMPMIYIPLVRRGG